MRQIFFLLILVLPGVCFGQDYILENLTIHRWTSKTIVSDFNIGTLKKIGLSKLKVPIDSIKNDVSIWEFRDKEIKVLNYKKDQGLDSLIVKCTFDYDKNKSVIRIFHFSQDSSFWEYSLGISSIGNYILLIRNN